MSTKLSGIIAFVADLDRAFAFYQDGIGLPLKFHSPEGSKFLTGEFTFARHFTSDKHAAGRIELEFSVLDLRAFHTEMKDKGVRFPIEPSKQDFGGMLAQFVGWRGPHVSVSGS